MHDMKVRNCYTTVAAMYETSRPADKGDVFVSQKTFVQSKPANGEPTIRSVLKGTFIAIVLLAALYFALSSLFLLIDSDERYCSMFKSRMSTIPWIGKGQIYTIRECVEWKRK